MERTTCSTNKSNKLKVKISVQNAVKGFLKLEFRMRIRDSKVYSATQVLDSSPWKLLSQHQNSGQTASSGVTGMIQSGTSLAGEGGAHCPAHTQSYGYVACWRVVGSREGKESCRNL